MAIYSIVVENLDPACPGSIVTQQINVDECTTFILRIPSTSNVAGPFNVYVDSELKYSSVSRFEIINGVILTFECEPPVDQYFAYIFPEPLDSVSQQSLGTYMLNNGGTYFGFANNGFAPPSTTNYAQNMTLYSTYPDWNGGVGNFITPVDNIKSPIRQLSGTGLDIFSCPVNQFNFETIRILHDSMINPNIRYNYTIWLPVDALGNTFVNMKVDVGTDPCDNSLFNDSIPDTTLAGINVEVPSGAVIPEGTYRVLWTYLLPTTAPINEDLYFKGDGIIS